MLVLNNTDSDNSMQLGMKTVQLLIDLCPCLTVLGNLRTWHDIDYFNEESENYFKLESELSKFKQEAIKKNWDIDLDLENLDYLYQK